MVSAEEDTAILNFAIENLDVADEKSIWERFKAQTFSERRTEAINSRFHNHLLPQLANAQLPTEDKLKLCKKYEITISTEFLKKLHNEAYLKISRNRTVLSYTMKVVTDGNPPETGVSCDSSAKPKPKRRFTADEDKAIWDYVLENFETTHCSYSFWKRFVENGNRLCRVVAQRFKVYLAPRIHEQDFDINTKLKIFLWCQQPVRKYYLEVLKEHANLEVDTRGRLKWYELIQRPGKRNQPESTEVDVKRARIELEDVPVEELYDEEEDVDLDVIFDSQFFKATARPLLHVKLEMEDGDDGLPHENNENQMSVEEEVLLKPVINNQVADDREQAVGAAENGLLTEMTRVVNVLNENMAKFETKMTRMGQNLEISLRNQITEVTTTVGLLKEEMRSEKSNGIGDEISSTRKKCLRNLLKLVLSIESPELAEIEQKIEQAIQEPDDDENPLPVPVLRPMLEAILTIISH